MSLRMRASKLFGRDKNENTVRVSRVDSAVFNDLRSRAAQIDEAISTPPTLPNGQQLDPRVWEKLAEDVFSAHYNSDEPSLYARENIDPRFHVNREVNDKTIRDESFADRRAMTRGQRIESAMALMGELGALANSYADELGKHGETQNEIAAAEDTIEGLDDMLAELRQERNELHGDSDELDETIRDLAQRKRMWVNELERAEQRQQAQAGDLIDAVRSAAQTAGEAATEAVEIASLVPGRAGGPGGRVSPDTMLALMERIERSPSLQRMLELLGKLELSMGNKRMQLRKGGYEEIVDIEQGDDLRNVLIGEKALLAHPIARYDFYRRYLDRSLMQYEMWSEEELKKGPLIVASDGSDSMRGTPNEFCRALSLASIGICNGEHRNCAALEFGSAGQLREFWFPGNHPLDTETALDFCEHFYAGGTDINQVLVRAKELIDNEAPFHSADLLIITDGGDRVTEQTIEIRDALRAMNVRIHGIVVGATVTDYVLTVCDAVSSVFDFAIPNSTSDRIAIDLT